jgi:hypothetical protein
LFQPFVESSESVVAHLATCESYHALDNSIACLCPPAHNRRLQDSKDSLATDSPSVAVSPPRQKITATSSSGWTGMAVVSKSTVVDCHATPCKIARRGVWTIHTISTHLPDTPWWCPTSTAHLDVFLRFFRVPTTERWHGWGSRQGQCITLL